MRSEEIRTTGTALRRRLEREIDTIDRFEQMMNRHRRGRIYTLALAAAAMLIVAAGVVLLVREPEAPIATSPTATTDPNGVAVAPEDPQELEAAIASLRESARPGRLVGIVHLGDGSNTGPPASSTQPVCEGAGPAKIVHNGQGVFVSDFGSAVVGEGVLIGSSYDADRGCILWFDVVVPSELGIYRIQIGGRPPVEVNQEDLDRLGWIIDMWSPAESAEPICRGLEDPDPQICLPIQGTR